MRNKREEFGIICIDEQGMMVQWLQEALLVRNWTELKSPGQSHVPFLLCIAFSLSRKI